MNIYLIGYMGCGKTTTGRKLAHLLGYQFRDMDSVIEQRHGSISTLFAQQGEEVFRQLEKEILQQTRRWENCVISTGGGTPCFNNNMDFINKHGISVYIRMHPHSLTLRLCYSKRSRPLIDHLDEEALEHHINQHLPQRETEYLKARLIVKGENIDVNKLAGMIKEQLLSEEK